MIGFDTNALVRMLVEDDEAQFGKLFSFDKKLQKRFPGYVVQALDRDDLPAFT